MIFESSAEFLKKVGSNLVLIDRNIKYFPRGAWKILGNLPHFTAEPRSGEAQKAGKNQEYSSMLRGLDSNQDRESQNLECYPNYTTPQNQYCLNFIKSLIL